MLKQAYPPLVPKPSIADMLNEAYPPLEPPPNIHAMIKQSYPPPLGPYGVAYRKGCGLSTFLSHKMFVKLFCKSPFSHKSVNLFVMSRIVKDTLMDSR